MSEIVASRPIDELVSRLPDSRLVTDREVVQGLDHDQARWARVGSAAAVLRAKTRDEVSHAVAACAELGIPVVTRGAGTGLSGGANATDGCLVLDVSGLNRIVDIDADNQVVVVEPGVVNDDLKAAVAAEGMWYPPDPASSPWSTIGGNVATNAGGLCCLKYGVTGDYVLGLEAVVGGPGGDYGARVRLGRRTTKGVAGIDLVSLYVGSEGTLGVITEVTLRLRPARTEPPRTVVGAFNSVVDAGRAVAACTRLGLVPAVLELLDKYCLQAVEDWKHLGLDPSFEALLLAQVDTPGSSGEADTAAIAAAFASAGAVWAEASTDAAEAEALFAARKLVYPALERLGPVLTEDVCVPRSQVPSMLQAIDKIATERDVRIATVAHAGDGNLHPLILMSDDDDGSRGAALLAFDDILAACIAHGGTVAGEHGIGLLKRDGMRREMHPGALAMQAAVKATLDPLDLFNPGKIFGDPSDGQGMASPDASGVSRSL